ncbi:MAG: MFS transporter [Acidimicrobiales bacterium]
MTDVLAPGGAGAALDRAAIQKHTIRVLLCSQAAGGVGLVATYIVSALIAKDITNGNKPLATVAAGCLSIGAAFTAFPLTKLMRSHGRRVGLLVGYLIGSVGAGIALVAAITRSYPLLCIGVLGAGAGNAANLATRYAASDLAPEHRRAFTIGLIVWATTIGSSTGSLSSGITSDVGKSLGLPFRAGSYLFSAIMFLVAAAIVHTFLRPDPLAVAGGVGKQTETNRQPASESIKLIWANPAARLAVAAMIVSQVTMVGVMALSPLHMDDGGKSQSLIGYMMTFHIFGMYLFSPLMGMLSDRIGRYPMLYISGGLCTWGALWAAVTPASQALGVFMANFLIGLGWCFGVVAGSSLIVSSFPIEKRVGVQGVGDMAMIGSGAIAGVSSGLLYSIFDYSGVNIGNAAFGVFLVVVTLVTYVQVRRSPTVSAAAAAS